MPGWGGLPGTRGTDYHLVKGPNGQVYAVYRVKIADGKYVNVTWKVSRDQFRALDINPEKIRKVGRQAVRSLNIFGDASEIVRRGADDEHPFQTYVSHLKELHGDVSWLGNKEFMSTMLMGWAENWTAAELQQALTQTGWYQKRTEYQRTWELDKSEGQRKAEINSWESRVTSALEDLYGEAMSLDEAGVKPEDITAWAKRIASGELGDPSDGFESWFARMQNKAEKVEGSAAWIARQQELEQQRAFWNRPEDVREQLRQEAFQWLGPAGVPDGETLMTWAEKLVSETRSDADWQKFLRQQAQNLYPWLGPEESWQDRASVYKSIAEDELGTSIGWDDNVLRNLGQVDDNGAFTGTALSFDEFSQQLRSSDRWWGTKKARDEGFGLVSFLTERFQGVA